MYSNIGKSLLVNTLWSFLGKFSFLIVNLIANIILARILTPEDFGKIAIVMFFIAISTVLLESGLSGALVRKQNVEEKDYSTVFIFNMVVSLFLIFLIYVFSNNIANFYNDTNLRYILIASSSLLFINALRITQTTKLIKSMDFKKKYLYEFWAILIGASIGVFFAVIGFGVWSIIALQLSTSAILTLIMWVKLGGLNIYVFDVNSFKSVYKFGVNTTLASLLTAIFDNIYQLIFAKYFSISTTGYYYQGKKLQEIPLGIMQSTVLSVVYSALSKLQNDREKFNALYQDIVKIFTLVVSIMCIYIYFFSEQIIGMLYGEKWIQATIYLKYLIVAAFFYLQEIFNRLIFKIFDRTEKILQLEIFKKIIQSISIFWGIFLLNIEVLLMGYVFISIISFFVNYYYARKIQNFFCKKDLINLFCIFFISCLVVLISTFIKDYLGLKGIEVFLLIPIVLILYLFLLSISRVIDFRNDFKKIISIMRAKK